MFYNLKIVFHVKLFFTVVAMYLKFFLIIVNNDPEKKNKRTKLWIAAQLFHVKHISVFFKKN